MWKQLAILILVANSCYGHDRRLSGQNICPQEERYTVTVEEPYKKTINRREFVWCAAIPPRCSKYHVQVVDALRTVEEVRVRLVDKCCPGYSEGPSNRSCVPHCAQCVNGDCTGPARCDCNAGHRGISCDQTCSAGRWGRNCEQLCECSNGGSCDPVTGSCACPAAWTGLQCTEPSTSDDPSVPVRIVAGAKISPENYTGLNETTKAGELVQKISVPSANDTTMLRPAKVDVTDTEDYHEDQSKILENVPLARNTQSRVLVSSVVVTLSITILIILTAMLVIFVSRHKKKRKSNGKKECNQIETITFVKRTFHAPLPDIPIFHHPAFSPEIDDGIVCGTLTSRKFPGVYENNSKGKMCLQYDQPPSTSVPDPRCEPIYDEIPTWRKPVPVAHGGATQ